MNDLGEDRVGLQCFLGTQVLHDLATEPLVAVTEPPQPVGARGSDDTSYVDAELTSGDRVAGCGGERGTHRCGTGERERLGRRHLAHVVLREPDLAAIRPPGAREQVNEVTFACTPAALVVIVG